MRTSSILLLAGTAAVAAAQGLNAEALAEFGLSPDAIPVSLVSKLASASRVIDGLTHETGFASFLDDYELWMSTYIQTQTVMPTDIPETATMDSRIALGYLEYTKEVAKGMEEKVGEKQYMDTKEEQEELEVAMAEFADVMEEAVGVIKKAMQTAEAVTASEKVTATATPASAMETEGAKETETAEGEEVEAPKGGNGTAEAKPTQPEGESGAMSAVVNVRALGAVLAAGVVAVLAL